MIYTYFSETPSGGYQLRIVSDEPGSFSHKLAKLSFRAYVTRDMRSFDAKTRTWQVAPEAREDVGRWVNYMAIICGAYIHLPDLPDVQGLAGPNIVEHSPVENEWPDFI